MDVNIDNPGWSVLSYDEKNRQPFYQQKETLDLFLERGAISAAQHDKSLHDLTSKMGLESIADIE